MPFQCRVFFSSSSSIFFFCWHLPCFWCAHLVAKSVDFPSENGKTERKWVNELGEWTRLNWRQKVEERDNICRYIDSTWKRNVSCKIGHYLNANCDFDCSPNFCPFVMVMYTVVKTDTSSLSHTNTHLNRIKWLSLLACSFIRLFVCSFVYALVRSVTGKRTMATMATKCKIVAN